MKPIVVRALLGALVSGGVAGLLYRGTALVTGYDATVCVAAALVAAIAGGCAFAVPPQDA